VKFLRFRLRATWSMSLSIAEHFASSTRHIFRWTRVPQIDSKSTKHMLAVARKISYENYSKTLLNTWYLQLYKRIQWRSQKLSIGGPVEEFQP
jgi:hypothetical protein